jgi:hypothetical protein
MDGCKRVEGEGEEEEEEEMGRSCFFVESSMGV